MRLILEARAGELETAGALDIDLPVRIDEDVVDGIVLEQGFDRSEPHHLVQDVIDELRQFLRIENDAFVGHMLGHEVMDLRAQFLLGHLVDGREIDLIDQPAMNSELGRQQPAFLGLRFNFGAGVSLVPAALGLLSWNGDCGAIGTGACTGRRREKRPSAIGQQTPAFRTVIIGYTPRILRTSATIEFRDLMAVVGTPRSIASLTRLSLAFT